LNFGLRISKFGFPKQTRKIVKSEIRNPKSDLLAMSKPKIARRCTVCGASIREAAFFCPQCGEQLTPQDREEKPTTSVVTTPLDEVSSSMDEADHKKVPDAERLETLEASVTPSPKTSAEKAPAGKVRDKIQRATTLVRDVEGDVKHRVQKVRQISSVVLDEAGYDPSLRFVLVAAALFLLFLLVMLLNKLIV
jgi:predicted  nucleic acid-binding Zn-ribbon protein